LFCEGGGVAQMDVHSYMETKVEGSNPHVGKKFFRKNYLEPGCSEI
jgi:hypothetical protein